MRVVVSPTWTVVVKANAFEDAIVERALSRSNPAYFFSKNKEFAKKRIGVYEQGMKYRKFPTGLLNEVEKVLKKHKRKLRILEDRRKNLKWVEPHPQMFPSIKELDKEQVQGARALLTQRVGYLEGVTGFGKTETMFTVFESLWQAQPIRAVLIVTMGNMFDQTVERAKLRLGEGRVHVIRGDKEELPEHGLIITTYQTLKMRLFGGTTMKAHKQLCKCNHHVRWHNPAACTEKGCKCKKFTGRRVKARVKPSKKTQEYCKTLDLAMLDEVQLFTGDYLDTMKMINATYRHGYSGTPRVEGGALRMLGLKGWVGPRAFLVDERRQVRIGRVAKTHVWWKLVGIDDPLPKHFDMKEKGAYAKAFRASVLKYYPFVREVIKAARWFHDHGLQTLVLVSWVEHAKFLEDMLKSVLPPEHVGRMDRTVGKKGNEFVKGEFEAGRVRVLVGNKIVGYGVDFKNLHALVNAGLGKARHSLYQGIGRGLRPKEGAPNILHVFHVLNGRHESFQKQSLKTIASYKRKAKMGVYVLHYDDPLELIAA